MTEAELNAAAAVINAASAERRPALALENLVRQELLWRDNARNNLHEMGECECKRDYLREFISGYWHCYYCGVLKHKEAPPLPQDHH